MDDWCRHEPNGLYQLNVIALLSSVLVTTPLQIHIHLDFGPSRIEVNSSWSF